MNKTSKNVFAVVLSVLMVLSMTTVAFISVFADDSGRAIEAGATMEGYHGHNRRYHEG